jgi:hypothetical protein
VLEELLCKIALELVKLMDMKCSCVFIIIFVTLADEPSRRKVLRQRSSFTSDSSYVPKLLLTSGCGNRSFAQAVKG